MAACITFKGNNHEDWNLTFAAVDGKAVMVVQALIASQTTNTGTTFTLSGLLTANLGAVRTHWVAVALNASGSDVAVSILLHNYLCNIEIKSKIIYISKICFINNFVYLATVAELAREAFLALTMTSRQIALLIDRACLTTAAGCQKYFNHF